MDSAEPLVGPVSPWTSPPTVVSELDGASAFGPVVVCVTDDMFYVSSRCQEMRWDEAEVELRSRSEVRSRREVDPLCRNEPEHVIV